MRNIFWGAIIIAIGLVRGDSVFRGDFSLLAVFFDALGVFFIIRGLFLLRRAKAGPLPPAHPPARPPAHPVQPR
jgi:hypothetical protein